MLFAVTHFKTCSIEQTRDRCQQRSGPDASDGMERLELAGLRCLSPLLLDMLNVLLSRGLRDLAITTSSLTIPSPKLAMTVAIEKPTQEVPQRHEVGCH